MLGPIIEEISNDYDGKARPPKKIRINNIKIEVLINLRHLRAAYPKKKV